ncbi:DUF1192 domain-containing protein [Oricola thermophila]|uniref:DUF1192 domain-containing protein n=1 Tax=Oricola thermophila TaxID=2742145 RepID=A0A6N1VKU5_9HYPH|nr:DUF1192 domain-containing protein [Oricola thermophila]QKV20415.1 DUF1192 domain-containing protein [Oricola thermophila]
MNEDLPKRRKAFEIGQDLDLLSEDELRETVAMLREEIARIERAIDSKSASRNAAEAFFRR